MKLLRHGIVPVFRNLRERWLDNDNVRHALRNHDRIGITGMWSFDHLRGDALIYHEDPSHNIVTTEGMNYILDVLANSGALGVNYMGIFKANVTPAAGDTAAAKLGSGGTYQACQDPADFDDAAVSGTSVSTGDWPVWKPAAAASGVLTNTAATCDFTMAASITVYGGFLTTEQDAADSDGVLICAKAFTASRAVVDNDILKITTTLTLTSS